MAPFVPDSEDSDSSDGDISMEDVEMQDASEVEDAVATDEVARREDAAAATAPGVDEVIRPADTKQAADGSWMQEENEEEEEDEEMDRESVEGGEEKQGTAEHDAQGGDNVRQVAARLSSASQQDNPDGAVKEVWNEVAKGCVEEETEFPQLGGEDMDGDNEYVPGSSSIDEHQQQQPTADSLQQESATEDANKAVRKDDSSDSSSEAKKSGESGQKPVEEKYMGCSDSESSSSDEKKSADGASKKSSDESSSDSDSSGEADAAAADLPDQKAGAAPPRRRAARLPGGQAAKAPDAKAADAVATEPAVPRRWKSKGPVPAWAQPKRKWAQVGDAVLVKKGKHKGAVADVRCMVGKDNIECFLRPSGPCVMLKTMDVEIEGGPKDIDNAQMSKDEWSLLKQLDKGPGPQVAGNYEAEALDAARSATAKPKAKSRRAYQARRQTVGDEPTSFDSLGKLLDAKMPVGYGVAALSQPADTGPSERDLFGDEGDQEAVVGDDEDAPADSPAHKLVRWDEATASFHFTFKRFGCGRAFSFTTPLARAKGDKEKAARICRLCYVQFQAGRSKAEVLKYQNQLFVQVCGARPPREQKPRVRPAAKQALKSREESLRSGALARLYDNISAPQGWEIQRMPNGKRLRAQEAASAKAAADPF